MRILGFIFLTVLLSTRPAVADDWISLAKGDPAYVTFSSGYFGGDREKDEEAELSLEYRSNYQFWGIKPFVHAAYITNNMTFLGAGILLDVQLGDNWIIQPSVAPTWWRGATDTLDLDYGLQFRSRLEIAYRFPDNSRLGLSATHSSNAGLGNHNPGAESIMLNVSVPTGFFQY
ncbi:acyloxyacyl hydrolase [Rhodospirillales bacterium]|nr:acyloxyacyl hydrolase [Rhodospirillales bacterium]